MLLIRPQDPLTILHFRRHRVLNWCSKVRQKIEWKWNINKTAAYYRHILSPKVFLKMPFKTFHSKIFLPPFWQKNTINEEKRRQFFWNEIIFYEFFNSKSASFSNLEVKSSFLQESTFLKKETNFPTYVRNFSISVALFGHFAIFWWFQNFKLWIRPSVRHFQFASKGEKISTLSGWFSFHFTNMGEEQKKASEGGERNSFVSYTSDKPQKNQIA